VDDESKAAPAGSDGIPSSKAARVTAMILFIHCPFPSLCSSANEMDPCADTHSLKFNKKLARPTNTQ